MPGPTPTAYEEDVFTWSQEQAAALRRLAGHRPNLAEPLDLLNIAEEIESLGISQWRELASRYLVLLVHLLKWRHQTARRSRSWRATIRTQRREIATLLRFSPGLKAKRAEELALAYARARLEAAEETRLPLATFPETCPFTVDEVEDESFWP
jgi:hypothetical protein